MSRRSSLLLATVCLGTLQGYAASIVRTSDPCVSPDGRLIAFAWQGDVWTVPSDGGTATRLTVHPAEDSFPRWSPNGPRVYCMSNRFGSGDVFSMTPQGGDVRRVTFDSGTEYPMSLSPDGQTLFGYTTSFGRIHLFKVSTRGGDLVRLTGHPMETEYYPSVSPDGQWIAYNTSGGAGNWRKPGQSGSSTSRIWMAPMGSPLTDHRMVFPGDRNDLFPTFLDKDTLAFVSNRSGAPNIWTGNTNGGSLHQVTHFTDGTVRLLSVSNDRRKGVFQKDSRVWTLDFSSGQAGPVEIQAPSDSPRDPALELTLATGARSFTVSPNGKRAIVAVRGDLFLLPEKGGTTRRLTTSPRLDGQPVWLDDKTVLYVAAGDGSKRSLKTVTVEGENKDFLADSLDLNCPTLSPDRKSIAYHRGNREIWVVPAMGGVAKKVVEGDFGNSIVGSRSFNWSPDSQWLVYVESLSRGVQASVVKPDGSTKAVIARIGKSASTPQFTSDGKAIAFSETEGVNYSEVRDSKSPVAIVDLVPQTVTYTEDDLDKIDAPKDEPVKDVVVRIVERGLRDRKRVLATGDAGTVWAGADGKSVYANIDGQFSSIDVKTGTVKPVTGVTGGIEDMELSANKQKLYFVQAGKANALTLASGSVAPVAFTAQYTVNQSAEEMALFDEVWWAMDRMYYNPAMNGKDWAGIRSKFGEIVPGVQSRDDFYALMGEMMELLDSSHLGATGPGGFRATTPDDTAWLGVDWDPKALDARGSFVVDKVYEGSAAALPDSELIVGDRILAVDGQTPGADASMATLLNRKAGKKVKLSIQRGEKTLDVTIRPTSSQSKSRAIYDDWVQWNKDTVDKLSGGKFGYIHIQGMDVPSLDVFLREIQTELNEKEGVILDVRYNGGGFTSHIILNTMLKTPWLIRTNRDNPGVKFSENNYRGNALELPAACLTNGGSFSNAEIFSEGFRRMKLGPVVGERTAGGVIGTSAYGMWDGGQIRMPASGAYAINGENLEQNGRRPDINVEWNPNAWLAGHDPQLEAAVKALLKKVGS